MSTIQRRDICRVNCDLSLRTFSLLLGVCLLLNQTLGAVIRKELEEEAPLKTRQGIIYPGNDTENGDGRNQVDIGPTSTMTIDTGLPSTMTTLASYHSSDNAVTLNSFVTFDPFVAPSQLITPDLKVDSELGLGLISTTEPDLVSEEAQAVMEFTFDTELDSTSFGPVQANSIFTVPDPDLGPVHYSNLGRNIDPDVNFHKKSWHSIQNPNLDITNRPDLGSENETQLGLMQKSNLDRIPDQNSNPLLSSTLKTTLDPKSSPSKGSDLRSETVLSSSVIHNSHFDTIQGEYLGYTQTTEFRTIQDHEFGALSNSTIIPIEDVTLGTKEDFDPVHPAELELTHRPNTNTELDPSFSILLDSDLAPLSDSVVIPTQSLNLSFTVYQNLNHDQHSDVGLTQEPDIDPEIEPTFDFLHNSFTDPINNAEFGQTQTSDLGPVQASGLNQIYDVDLVPIQDPDIYYIQNSNIGLKGELDLSSMHDPDMHPTEEQDNFTTTHVPEIEYSNVSKAESGQQEYIRNNRNDTTAILEPTTEQLKENENLQPEKHQEMLQEKQKNISAFTMAPDSLEVTSNSTNTTDDNLEISKGNTHSQLGVFVSPMMDSSIRQIGTTDHNFGPLSQSTSELHLQVRPSTSSGNLTPDIATLQPGDSSQVTDHQPGVDFKNSTGSEASTVSAEQSTTITNITFIEPLIGPPPLPPPLAPSTNGNAPSHSSPAADGSGEATLPLLPETEMFDNYTDSSEPIHPPPPPLPPPPPPELVSIPELAPSPSNDIIAPEEEMSTENAVMTETDSSSLDTSSQSSGPQYERTEITTPQPLSPLSTSSAAKQTTLISIDQATSGDNSSSDFLEMNYYELKLSEEPTDEPF